MTYSIANEYQVVKKIGAGSFGQVYLGKSINKNIKVAIKLEKKSSKSSQLRNEYYLYKYFNGFSSIPKYYYYSSDNTHNILVIDYLGRSLDDLYTKCGQKLSLKTVLMLADQMISCIQFIHSKSFIHNDIKPENFVMGRNNRKNQVHIIDFGLAMKYRDPETHKHRPYETGRGFNGTPRYSSVAALKGIRPSRRDDMEALGFLWMYFLRGNLPWMGVSVKGNNEKRFEKLTQYKESVTFESLCNGYPDEFKEYLEDVRKLEFEQEPEYAKYRQRFRDLFLSSGYVFDYVYDWVEKEASDKNNISDETNKSNDEKNVETAKVETKARTLQEVNNNSHHSNINNNANVVINATNDKSTVNSRTNSQKDQVQHPNLFAATLEQTSTQEKVLISEKINPKEEREKTKARKMEYDVRNASERKQELEQGNVSAELIEPRERYVQPDPSFKIVIDMNNLPDLDPLPDGPFPRPPFRSKYPKWMAIGGKARRSNVDLS